MLKKIILISLFLCISLTAGTFKDLNTKVKLISVWTTNGDLLIQTEPRIDVSALDCTDNYWLVLPSSYLGQKNTLSILLTAQATGKTITIRAEGNGSKFCYLKRVILK